MQIDCHPSPRRSFTPFSTKRARSPEPTSTSFLDRPLKRPVVILNPSTCTDYFSFCPSSSSPGTPNRPPLEDWVSQAGCLSIDSPLTSEREQPEEDMTMDGSQEVRSLPNCPIPATNDQSPTVARQDHFRSIKVDFLYQKRSSFTTTSTCEKDTSSTVFQALGSCCVTPITEPPASTMATEPRFQRKLRFALGPRANCDLCRRGVKGHSAHWI